MKTITLFLLQVVVLSATAQNVFREDFNTYVVNQNLSGQGQWTNAENSYGLGSCSTSNCSNAKVIQQTVGFLNWGTSNRSVELIANGDGCGVPFPTQNAGEIYIGFVLRLTSCAYSSQEFLRISGSSSATAALKVYVVRLNSSQYSVGISKNSGNIVWSSVPFTLNSNQLVVVRYSMFNGGSDDILRLYTNPVVMADEPALPNALTNNGEDVSNTLDRMVINLRNANAPVGRMGLVSIAQTWESLRYSALSQTEFNATQFIAQYEAGEITIQNSQASTPATMTLYSTLGQSITTTKINLDSGTTRIQVPSNLSPGMYILHFQDKYKQEFIKKLMVN